jgi:predicted nucleic acid-binding protein
MSPTLKIYLDTSVISFLFAKDAPDKQEATIDFFRDFIRTSVYDTYISDFVVAEINNTTDKKLRDKMLSVLDEYPMEFLDLGNRNELDSLAARYVSEGIIPEKKLVDAYHIAVAVTNQINILVSWNYKHLANVNRERRINVINFANSYQNEIRIITPLELMDYDK